MPLLTSLAATAQAAGFPSGVGGMDIFNPTAYGRVPSIPATSTNTSSTTGTDRQAQMIANLPGYLNMGAADSSNIGNNLAGQISPDVLAAITQAGAERGIATGSPGSANANASFLRALGLTSMQLQQLGHSQLTDAMNRTPMRESSQSSQTIDNGVQAAIAAAAPNPAAAARANLAATRAGMGAGAGAVGGFSTPGGLPSGGTPWSLPETPMPTTLGSLGGGFNAPSASSFDWNSWATGLPGQKTTGGGDFYAGNAYDDAQQNSYYSSEPDTYNYDPYKAPLQDLGVDSWYSDDWDATMNAPASTAYDSYSDTSSYDPYAEYDASYYFD